jgi:nucleoside diphosphate kinase
VNSRTLALIKPDAVQNMGKILYAIQEAGFIVSCLKMVTLSPSQAGEFYSEHQGKPFYEYVPTACLTSLTFDLYVRTVYVRTETHRRPILTRHATCSI